MIPPASAYMAPMSGQTMSPSANKLTQQMQDMQIGPPPPSLTPTNYNNQNMIRSPFVNYSSPPSPYPNGQGSTTVTYSGSPHATYPYNNNNNTPSQIPLSGGNSNFQNVHPGLDSKRISNPFQPGQMGISEVPTVLQHNGMSNGHDVGKPQTNPNHFSQGPSPPNATLQYPQMSPPSASHPAVSPPSFPPPSGLQMTSSPLASYVSSPPNPSSFPPPPGSQMPSSPLASYASSLSQPSSMASASYAAQYSGMHSSSPIYPGTSPASPSYSGVPPGNRGWPGSAQNTAGNYPYPPQSTQQQQPRKLDLDQMPSLVQVREEDRNLRGGIYMTDVKGQPPPLVTTDFAVQDRGMCSPRCIRSSVYCLPNQPDMLKQTGLPFALTITPMARTQEGEKAPPLCLFREQGPLRCKRCKAYICPFMTFMEGGRCFQCAFCKVVTEVPQDYFCFLDGMGERTDKYHRPELCLGSYEYLATQEYCRNDEMPNPPAYLFMMEVSHATFRNGLVPLLCENMKNVLQCLKNDEENDTSNLRIGFVTYNSVLHFYNMKKNLTQPHIMVLSDVHNAFVPLLDGFLVTLAEAEALVDGLMDHIPRLFVNEPASEIILGPVVQVGLEALKNANCSGKLLIFHSTLPNADAPGKLPHREGQKLLGTDKQKSVLSPQHDFYSKLAQDCVAGGCAVDLFLFPNAYIDIASISPLCRHTGGQIYKYTYFQSHTDGDRFLEDLERNVTTPTAFDAVLRVRTSAGISPVFYYGNFFMSNTTDIELSAVDGHKSVTIELAYDDKLPENETVCIQAALLYTTIKGERRIRVHNLALTTSVSMPDIFKGCEMDTIINFFAKQALKQLLEHSPQQMRSSLVSRSVRILACYRKHCASASVVAQLILPDSLKLLPLCVNCVLKSDAIGGGSDMSLDDRSFAMLAVNSMDVKSTAIYFYPTLIPLHDVDPDSDSIPSPIRCSIEKLEDNGAYLLENGIYMFLWIGQAVRPDWLQDVFAVHSANQVDKQKTSLPDLNTPLSRRIRNIIEDMEMGRQWYMRLTVMVQGDKLEVVFRQFLVEDRGTDGSASYVDFLCHLHKEISKNL